MYHRIHKLIVQSYPQISSWFESKSNDIQCPIYSSFDIRNDGSKITIIDGNIYPAGFNNICSIDLDYIAKYFDDYLTKYYGTYCNRLLLLTEEHNRNPYYWDNVIVIANMLRKFKREVRVGVPQHWETSRLMHSVSHGSEIVYPVLQFQDGNNFDRYCPDLIISNNDFSKSYEQWACDLKITINPLRELGWYRRRKSNFFYYYNGLATEFAQLIGLDPWFVQVKTEVYENFDINSEESRKKLAEKVDYFISELQQKYNTLKIEKPPFVFIKNNSGTYGLGVVPVQSGEDILNWNYKTRKKMKSTKGGGQIDEVIIQEGVQTIVQNEKSMAEPVMYFVGSNLAGGFLRTHSKKGPMDSLNSPGVIYKPFCVYDDNKSYINHCSENHQDNCDETDCFKNKIINYEEKNIYTWIARLGALAIGLEFSDAKELKYKSR